MENNNPVYNDCFFSEEGGLEESLWVFVKGNNIERFSENDDIYTGETGFGSGLNFFALVNYIRTEIPQYSGKLDYFSCEKYPLHPDAVRKLHFPLFSEDNAEHSEYMDIYENIYSSLNPGLNTCDLSLFGIDIRLSYFFGDAAEGLIKIGEKRDIWFLDGHDPEKNPDMWSRSIFKLITENSHTGTSLATYTAKGLVKQGLRDAGFFIKRKKGYGKKRHMITGIYKG